MMLAMVTYNLQRRGFDLGSVSIDEQGNDELSNWSLGKAILLKSLCLAELPNVQTHLARSFAFYESILEDGDPNHILAQPPYLTSLETQFDCLGSSFNEGDPQEIETVLFDALESHEAHPHGETKIAAEDLWMKISWLSFHEEDASMRFRFSFGEDLVEDVAADQRRQHYAALLADTIFPESYLVTDNTRLTALLQTLLKRDSVTFVERIVYFNSPNGGAYLHHDLERGHAGVVFAQLSGTTFWLALPKQQLVAEIIAFVEAGEWPKSIDTLMQKELFTLANNPERLSSELESFANQSVIHLINETKAFTQQLIRNGHGRTVHTGDILILPQTNNTNCCWHSVFCLDDTPGQALSFAIR